MNKKLIRLTESDLHRIVRMSVNKVLRESTIHSSRQFPQTPSEILRDLNGIRLNVWDDYVLDGRGKSSVDYHIYLDEYTYDEASILMSYDADWDNGTEIKVKKEDSPEAERLITLLYSYIEEDEY